jgi:hypothetical protein
VTGMPPRSRAAATPEPGPPQSAEPPGQGSPDAAATSEAAAAPPAQHAADPPPDGPQDTPPEETSPGQRAEPAPADDEPPAAPEDQPPEDQQPGDQQPGDQAPQDQPAQDDGQVIGGRLADLAQGRAMPEGVPYAIAREPLYVVNPEAAAAPVRAFNPGDRVPAELVEKFGWHDLTDIPEWATAPPAPATPENTGSEE